ncbi:hypothetical protein [Streptomyces sp. NPDC020298]|uniref:hypothetical protein n=1 Tax=unclassified Streptomyces TaxID=2593676 RepID=UPI0033CABD26
MSAHETLGAGRGTFFDKRANGTFGPVEDIKVDVLVTPEQWDALGRIGAPGSLASDTCEEVRVIRTPLELPLTYATAAAWPVSCCER